MTRKFFTRLSPVLAAAKWFCDYIGRPGSCRRCGSRATDFPHRESEYPHSLDVVEKNFAGVPADETHRMVAGNVIEFFHLETDSKST